MEQRKLEIRYKIYMEAEDISQSRIHSSVAFLKNRLENSSNKYLKNASFDDESDLDAFMLRFYVENEIIETTCSSPEDAESFVIDLAEILDAAAAAHSFMDVYKSLYFMKMQIKNICRRSKSWRRISITSAHN